MNWVGLLSHWCSVALCRAVWCFVVLCGALECFVVLCGSLWSSVVLCDPLWCCVVFCDVSFAASVRYTWQVPQVIYDRGLTCVSPSNDQHMNIYMYVMYMYVMYIYFNQYVYMYVMYIWYMSICISCIYTCLPRFPPKL
jgi:hypothetical protein